MVFQDGRHHRRPLALVQRVERQAAGRIHLVALAADAGQGLLHALEAADRQPELLAHAGIGAGVAGGHLGHAGGQRRQRDAAALRQTTDQHLPAAADAGLAADDPLQRREHVPAVQRTILERHVERQVALTAGHAGRACRQQQHRDATLERVAQQAIRIAQGKGQTDQRCHRPQRDVALLEAQAYTEHLLALMLAAADHAHIRQRAGIRPGLRAGQGEAGNVLASGQTRQVMILLRLCSVMPQQLGRAERIGHHDGDGGGHAAAGELHHHRRMRPVAETLATELRRDGQPEEAFLAQRLPHGRRQIGIEVRDAPVVELRAQPLDRTVQKGLLVVAQRLVGKAAEPFPVRLAGEQLALPPHAAGLHRLALGIRQRRQLLAVEVQHARGYILASPVIGKQQHSHGQPQQPQRQCQPPRQAADARQQECGAHDDGGRRSRQLSIRHRAAHQQQRQQPQRGGHWPPRVDCRAGVRPLQSDRPFR